MPSLGDSEWANVLGTLSRRILEEEKDLLINNMFNDIIQIMSEHVSNAATPTRGKGSQAPQGPRSLVAVVSGNVVVVAVAQLCGYFLVTWARRMRTQNLYENTVVTTFIQPTKKPIVVQAVERRIGRKYPEQPNTEPQT